MIITVDGFAASGKSSLARELAKHLGFEHVDAGMMFRAAALSVMKELDKTDIKFVDSKVFLNGEDVTGRVREEDVTNFVSDIGGSERFRALVYSLERAKADKNVVFSGRDTGTKVFPDADIKFFVEADIDIRAQRRFQDYKGTMTLDVIKQDLIARDNKDLKYGSLIKPKDAIVIDNSYVKLEDNLIIMLKFVEEMFFKKLNKLLEADENPAK